MHNYIQHETFKASHAFCQVLQRKTMETRRECVRQTRDLGNLPISTRPEQIIKQATSKKFPIMNGYTVFLSISEKFLLSLPSA